MYPVPSTVDKNMLFLVSHDGLQRVSEHVCKPFFYDYSPGSRTVTKIDKGVQKSQHFQKSNQMDKHQQRI